jgi:hypothetical protein
MPKTKPPKRKYQRGLAPLAMPFEDAVRRVLCTTPPPEPKKRRKKPA